MKAKRYMLFSGDNYYPQGGWDDHDGSFDTINEARELIKIEPRRRSDGVLYLIYIIDERAFDWYQLIDLNTGKEINLFPNSIESYIEFN